MPSSPTAARRKSEGKSTLPELAARQLQHKQQRPGRRCAASARRGNCRSSSRLARKDSRDEIFEARITAERVEPVINKYPAEISRVERRTILIALLEEADRLVFVTERYLNDRH